jgi:hypothetical protein
MEQFSNGSYIPIVMTLMSLPLGSAIAQENHFNNFNLAIGFNQTAGIVMGYTGGSYSLASIANKDRHGNPCMGYGDPEPDHTMILENDFSHLTLKVNSGDQDTTLVVQGPDNRNIICAFGQEEFRDAILRDANWKAGTYKIWVGSMKPNQRSNYLLSVEQ